MSQQRFNIRVYGILINSNKEILISDEHRFDTSFTKFPGGGLEWGEGMKDCLIREFKEEMDIAIEVGELFYCTDFFVSSAFIKTDQIISVYFYVNYPNVDDLSFAEYTIPFEEDIEKFRWVPLNQLSEDMFSFPIDKFVAKKLNPSTTD